MVAILRAYLVSCRRPVVQVLTIVKQQASASAVGGLYALLFLLSGSLMMVGTAAIISLGLGPFLSILAALHFVCTLAAFIQIVQSCSSAPMPQPLISRHGSTAFMKSALHVLATSFKDTQESAGCQSTSCPSTVQRTCTACKPVAEEELATRQCCKDVEGQPGAS